MNFGNIDAFSVVLILLAWALPIALMVWFIMTVSSMASSLREIANRMVSLEQALRDGSPRNVLPR